MSPLGGTLAGQPAASGSSRAHLNYLQVRLPPTCISRRRRRRYASMPTTARGGQAGGQGDCVGLKTIEGTRHGCSARPANLTQAAQGAPTRHRPQRHSRVTATTEATTSSASSQASTRLGLRLLGMLRGRAGWQPGRSDGRNGTARKRWAGPMPPQRDAACREWPPVQTCSQAPCQPARSPHARRALPSMLHRRGSGEGPQGRIRWPAAPRVAGAAEQGRWVLTAKTAGAGC